ncbi:MULTISPECIES: hypothetical protein [Streptomyces]|uniref:Uncharacterized protein n=1 Tax=Streptomyces graminearus TaxID=284030 RepID=K4HQA5_9ACTN|nr:hypothetical protein [Streptomyces noursei]AFU52883.1 hypothetical protein [Streptomyces graminearus]MCE4941649.1 hypothetical protein [Streptomyces noursei]
MRKLRKASVVVALIGSISLLGAGTAQANAGPDHGGPQVSQKTTFQQQSSGRHHGKRGGRKVIIRQSTRCRTFENNIDVLGGFGFLHHWGHEHRGWDRRGVRVNRIGSTVGCNNVIRL